MELPEPMPLSHIKVGEHFILQGTEYVRMGDKEEDGGIFCKGVKEGASGLLSGDRQVIKLIVEPTLPT